MAEHPQDPYSNDPHRNPTDALRQALAAGLKRAEQAIRQYARDYGHQAQSLAHDFDPQEATRKIQGLLRHGVDAVFDDVAEGVGRLGVVFVNVYTLNATGGRWFLLDTGLPGFAGAILAACKARFGEQKPEAIILTHAHFDHAGNVEWLAKHWDVPVYAHRQEMPYLTGGADYPPADPTPGGAICFLSRFFPMSGYDLVDRVDLRTLEGEEGDVPGLNGWKWMHTPGHTQGHLSLFRDFDRLLVAGDALATMDMDDWTAQFTRRRELSRPPTPVTTDWQASRQSVEKLANLGPQMIAAGHGLPMSGRHVSIELHGLAETLSGPKRGRYAPEPVHFDEAGRPTHLPPRPADPLKPKLGIAAVLALVGLGIAAVSLRRRRG